MEKCFVVMSLDFITYVDSIHNVHGILLFNTPDASHCKCKPSISNKSPTVYHEICKILNKDPNRNTLEESEEEERKKKKAGGRI